MQLTGYPKSKLRSEALEFIDLYKSLGERAEVLLPKHIFDNLKAFVRICYEEPDDPAKQQAEIQQYLLQFREQISGYVDVSLMLYPQGQSKAFAFSELRNQFKNKLQEIVDADKVGIEEQKWITNIINAHDFSVGTPPVIGDTVKFLENIIVGDELVQIRRFRDVIGIIGDIDEAHWNYLMDTLEQMVIQSTHYTTKSEKRNFLHRSEWAVNFKGLNGLIRTVISGNADTAIDLIRGEVFDVQSVRVVENVNADALYEEMQIDQSSIFLIKVKHMRKNIFGGANWFPMLSRLIIVDDSPESRASNTSLVFSFHNGIINTINKAHTKKLGAPANSQLNLRLILENVNSGYLEEFSKLILLKIDSYKTELKDLQLRQIGTTDDYEKNTILFKFDDFTRQILKDKFALERLYDYIQFVLNTINEKKRKEQTRKLVNEFEDQIRDYFYSGSKFFNIITVLEGGGRNQIRSFGEFLLQNKLSAIDEKIIDRCRTIINFIPDNYKRTLHNHFHKNFGINLLLEKYQKYVANIDNLGDNKGRFNNILIDLGVYKDYVNLKGDEQKIIKSFISDLSNLEKTSISDDVQMIIRDLLFSKDSFNKPYIIYNKVLAWEYTDLFPDDKFNINPFDIEIENKDNQRIDYERLLNKLVRIKATLQLFDDSGHLWDRFCENVTIIINDPSNPTGYSDFNTEGLLKFLKFINNSKVTLFLDEAYVDSVKIKDKSLPKWRSISRYIINNKEGFSRIKFVSSLSTTKNLAGSGDRLGAIVLSKNLKQLAEFIRKKNPLDKGNSNSLYILNIILAYALQAKKLKDRVEAELPKNASRSKIRKLLENYIQELSKKFEKKSILFGKSNFEGSPMHMFLLDELVKLAKLDILDLPDDFKYKNTPFFSYYSNKLVDQLEKFRLNKVYRHESNLRLEKAKKIAKKIVEKNDNKSIKIIESDGSYLFNILFTDIESYTELETFTKTIAKERGVAVLPYQTGVVRFSLGGYLSGTENSYQVFEEEFRVAFNLLLNYWNKYKLKQKELGQNSTEKALQNVFGIEEENDFLDAILNDFEKYKNIKKQLNISLKINENRSLYHASPAVSGISITTIGNSKNSVIEFQNEIGNCRTVKEFIQSKAFTKIYENLLPIVYKNIPQIKYLNFNTVASRYSKATLLKYIQNKKNFHPNNYVLDDPEEKNIMREILIEIEDILFSDSKMKILTLPATGNFNMDATRLEGVNNILKKHIQEIFLHFNLPFEQESIEPSRKQIIEATCDIYEEITGLHIEKIDLNKYVYQYVDKIKQWENFNQIAISDRSIGLIIESVKLRILNRDFDFSNKILYLFLLQNDNSFYKLVTEKLNFLQETINDNADDELRIFAENTLTSILPQELQDILSYIIRKKDIKVEQADLHDVTQKVVNFIIELQNLSKGTNYYNKYNHTLIKVVETHFKKQNSSVNEMIQHGITLYRNYKLIDKTLEKFEKGSLKWINDLMVKCGVISIEQPVQRHTRIVTDAKKREYSFHKIDQETEETTELIEISNHNSENNFIKKLKARLPSEFFENRLAEFVSNLDPDDYRCKITKQGLVNELIVFQKGYIKYLTDNFRLNLYEEISLQDAQNFIPDIIVFLGAPEKVISFPQIGYFNLPGPFGNIKTIVTPLKKEVDYFGDIKKPRLTVLNEKVKEMGGIPKHGSLFAVELEDGSIFVVEIDGDSGVGKSEMIAALILKWLRQNLPGVRSIKLIAGDMFHVFRDNEGNLYGIGTEVGDFSRVTDFDPDFIKYYKFLFESSADSNITDLNSRSTISGLCDILMPYKIDIILTAHNYSKDEAGITRVDNPENFLLYIDSHGERKEKATSQDGPNFQRTLQRYTADNEIVEVLAKHGNYIDDVLDWEKDIDGTYYLASSYKLMDKIDIEEVISKIFKNKKLYIDTEEYIIKEVKFDFVQNRFSATLSRENQNIEKYIDRKMFSQLFDSLASTPGGQPFVAQEDQTKTRYYLIDVLKGGSDGKGKGRQIQCGIISTEIGKKGKELSGPQKAAEAMKNLIQEARIKNPEINDAKNKVRQIVKEKYDYIFESGQTSNDIWRYNFYLYQLDKMRKAKFVRIDNPKMTINLDNVNMFVAADAEQEFSPLLVTPNLNIELSSFSETYEELMSLPNYPEFANEFSNNADKLYEALGYSEETKINNMITQLLLFDGYIDFEDLSKGRITEKVNRETIAAAKYAVIKETKRRKI